MNKCAKLHIFHPSPYMVEELNSLLALYAPELAYENVVVPDLLDRAMQTGITDELRTRTRDIITNIPDQPKSVVLCACSTFGGCAEEMQPYTANRIIRIDRPMAERAVQTGSRIGIAAALESTLDPTRTLLLDVAGKHGKSIHLQDIHCPTAWARKQAKDSAGYISEIVNTIELTVAGLDVIVLAQGSMAPAAEKLAHLGVPVLTSPRLAIERVREMCRGTRS